MTIRIFTKPFCPYCSRAKGIFARRMAPVTEIAGPGNPDAETYVRREIGPDAKLTWPQIFIGDVYVGGSDELAAMEKDGRLDALLPTYGGM